MPLFKDNEEELEQPKENIEEEVLVETTTVAPVASDARINTHTNDKYHGKGGVYVIGEDGVKRRVE